MTDRCCICYRSVEEDKIVLIKINPRAPLACPEHLREAVERSDSRKPTESEWQDLVAHIEAELMRVVSADGVADK